MKSLSLSLSLSLSTRSPLPYNIKPPFSPFTFWPRTKRILSLWSLRSERVFDVLVCRGRRSSSSLRRHCKMSRYNVYPPRLLSQPTIYTHTHSTLHTKDILGILKERAREIEARDQRIDYSNLSVFGRPFYCLYDYI